MGVQGGLCPPGEEPQESLARIVGILRRILQRLGGRRGGFAPADQSIQTFVVGGSLCPPGEIHLKQLSISRHDYSVNPTSLDKINLTGFLGIILDKGLGVPMTGAGEGLFGGWGREAPPHLPQTRSSEGNGDSNSLRKICTPTLISNITIGMIIPSIRLLPGPWRHE